MFRKASAVLWHVRAQMLHTDAAHEPVRTMAAFARRQVVLGRTEGGRPIVAWEIGDPAARRVTLVVGCVHGNEPAGISITKALVRVRPPARTLLWIVPDLNPDGVAATIRQNSDGVDLNRNFPWHWRRLGQPGSTYYAGPRPASEVETRIAIKLIRQIHPTISVWFHQHLNAVDDSSGDARIALRFARRVGMRTLRLTRYPGGAVNWETEAMPGTTAFVVELPAGPVPAARIGVFTAALATLNAR